MAFGATAAGLFCASKRLLSTSCNKQGQRSNVASSIFHGVIPDAFEVRRIVCRKLNKP